MLMAELAISTSMIAMSSASFVLYGWEKAIFYQFCMNQGPVQVSIIQEITNKNVDNLLFKILRFVPSSVGQGLIITEVLIYLWIICHLWKHNTENHLLGIITQHMKKDQKNVITLLGQVATFVVEITFSIYAVIHTSDIIVVDSSVMPINQIVASTVASIIQLLTSHEIRRFLRNELNLY